MKAKLSAYGLDVVTSGNALLSAAKKYVPGGAYSRAPVYYMLHPGTGAPGWHRIYNNAAELNVLEQGQVTSAMMQYIDFVLSTPGVPSGYVTKARRFLPTIERIITAHDSSYRLAADWAGNGKDYSKVPGAYYYKDFSRPVGVYSNPLPINHHACILAASVRLNKYRPNSGYMTKANFVTYFKNYVTTDAGGAYVWTYDPFNENHVEDVGHAVIDVSFFDLANQRGFGFTARGITRFARTYARNLLKTNGTVALGADGSGTQTDLYQAVAIGQDLFDYAYCDPSSFDRVLSYFKSKYPIAAYYGRTALGWGRLIEFVLLKK